MTNISFFKKLILKVKYNYRSRLQASGSFAVGNAVCEYEQFFFDKKYDRYNKYGQC